MSQARSKSVVGNTSSIQTQLSGKQATSEKNQANGYAGLDGSSKLSVSQIPSEISAANIGTGSVSNTEFGYLDGVTSSIQTQLDGKAASSHTHSGYVTGYGYAFGNSYRVPLWTGSQSLSYSSDLFFDTSSQRLYTPYLNLSSARIYTSGQLYVQNMGNNGGGILCYYNTSTKEVFYQYSTSAHKEKIETIQTTMDELMEWRPVEFKWKQAFGGTNDLGLIAEDVARVAPRAAFFDKPWKYKNDATGEYEKNEDGTPVRLDTEERPAGVKYEKAWIPMLAAVQDFYRKHQKLEAEVRELKSQLGGAL